jgi:tetratricopeptide (TPR) repeat protein/O-antigen ligase
MLMPFRTLPRLKFVKYPLIIFMIASFISALCSAYVHDSLLEWSNLLCFVLIFIMVFDLWSEPRLNYAFIHFLLFLASLICFIGLFFFKAYPKEQGGIYGTFYQVDVFGGFLLLFLPLAYALYLSSSERSKIVLYGMLTALFGLCIMLTFSRGVMLSLMLALAIFFLAMLVKKIEPLTLKNMILKTCIIIILILLSSKLFLKEKSAGVIPERLGERATALLSEGDSSRQARWQFWKAAVKISLNHPLVGTGLKTFGRFYPPFEDDIRHFSKYTHNLYLQFLSEMGYPALIAFLALLAGLSLNYGRLLSSARGDPFHYWSHVGIGIGALGSFIHHFVDVDWFFPAIPAIWCALFASTMGRATWRSKEDAPETAVSEEWYKDFIMNGLSRQMTLQFFLCVVLMILSVFVAIPFFAQRYAETADTVRSRGKVDEALQLYSVALRIDPLSSEIERNIADLYFTKSVSNNDPSSLLMAEEHIKRALALDPYRAVLMNYVGKVLWRKDDYDGAITYFDRAIALDGKNYPSFYNDAANYYLMKNDYQKAAFYFKKAIDIFPLDIFQYFWIFRASPTKLQLSESYMGLGNIHMKDKNYKDAEPCLENAMKLNPRNFSAIFGLGYIKYQQGKYDEAIEHFNKALQLDARFPLCHLFIGYCYRAKGNKEEAARFINKALELDPKLRVKDEGKARVEDSTRDQGKGK